MYTMSQSGQSMVHNKGGMCQTVKPQSKHNTLCGAVVRGVKGAYTVTIVTLLPMCFLSAILKSFVLSDRL